MVPPGLGEAKLIQFAAIDKYIDNSYRIILFYPFFQRRCDKNKL
jgi:hypothetical protein